MRLVAGLVVAIASLAIDAGLEAQACMCAGPLELLYPANGATDVPLNTTVLVVGDAPGSVVVRERVSGLEVAAVETVWPGVFAERWEDWHLFRPVLPLSPLTEYRIERDGLVVCHFLTGEEEDPSPPTFDGLAGISASIVPPGDDCGGSLCWTRESLHQIELDYGDFPEDMLYAVLEIRRQGEAEPFFTLPVVDRPQNQNFPSPHIITSTICGPTAPLLEQGTTYCARLIAHDGAGNVSGDDAPDVCTETIECEPDPSCYLFSECVPRRPSAGGCAVGRTRDPGWLVLVPLLVAFLLRRLRSRP